MHINKRTETKKHIKGVILAGGQGTRLKPLTDNLDKPLLPVRGKPMILHSVERLIKADITDIILVIRSRNASKYFDLIGDGNELGANSITYIFHPETSIGMPHALGLTEHLINDNEAVFVLCADVLIEQDLKPPLEEFKRLSAGALILTVRVEDSAGFTLMESHGDKIQKIYDKDPNKHIGGIIDLGLGIYPSNVFTKIRELGQSKKEVGIWELNRLYLKNNELNHFVINGAWDDAGLSLDHYNSIKQQPKILILGAGIAGLSASIYLKNNGIDPIILEKEEHPGGLFTNSAIENCDFDYGPKILILDDSENSAEILTYLGNNYQEFPINESVYLSKFGLLGFPIQRNLYQLPIEIRKTIIDELTKLKADFSEINNFKEWLINSFGRTLSELVLIPYEQKKWQTDLSNMDYRWALKRPIKTTITEMLAGASQKLPPKGKYYYPKKGNISTFTNELINKAGNIELNTKIEKIDLVNKIVYTKNQIYQYDALISTIPLDVLANLTAPLPKILKSKSEKLLRKLSIVVINLVYKGNHDLEGTAIYFPEKQFIFRRVSILENLCPALKREGKTPISVEVSINPDEQIDMENIYNNVLQDLSKIPQFKKLGSPIAHEIKMVDFAYPMQIRGHASHVGDLHRYYATYDVYNCGRGGSYNYCNGDEAYETGKLTAKRVINNFKYNKEVKNELSITVGIPSYKSGESLLETVKSIRQSDSEYDIKIVISIDGPDFDTTLFNKIRTYGVKVIENDERQGQTARNAQLANLTTTDLLILTQDDVLFEEDTITKIISAFHKDKTLTMIAPYIKPLPPKVDMERIVRVGVTLSKKMMKKWNKGDNYLASIGRCLAFRTEFIHQFEIDERIVNCDAYYYFENKRLGGKFLYLEEATVLYRLPQNLSDHLKQVRKFVVSQKELSNFLRTDLTAEYKIPKSIIITTLLTEVVRNPIELARYIYLSYVARHQPKHFYEDVTRFWDIDASTKNL